jgi:RNA polymerase sigma factor (sigma-70 family)
MADAPLRTVLRQIRRTASEKAFKDSSDSELLGRYLTERDEAAFVVLLKRHSSMVLNVCRRIQRNEHDAEDAFQATFLLLARKANSIRKHESVAGWLYRVAERLAVDMSESQTRRHARERDAAARRTASSVSDGAWQELQETLDSALRQLPDKYRAPLLLCYLEGKTQEQAALQLGCPLGTVRSRLARGRDRLRQLLVRQGMRLSGPALALGLVASSGSAAAPSALVSGTVRAALDYAAGQSATALVSA